MIDFRGHTARPLEVAVVPAGRIEGRVTGTSRPGEFSVALTGEDSTQMAFAETSGRFEFTGLRPGKYKVMANGPGGKGTIVEVEVRSGATTTVEVSAGQTKEKP